MGQMTHCRLPQSGSVSSCILHLIPQCVQQCNLTHNHMTGLSRLFWCWEGAGRQCLSCWPGLLQVCTRCQGNCPRCWRHPLHLSTPFGDRCGVTAPQQSLKLNAAVSAARVRTLFYFGFSSCWEVHESDMLRAVLYQASARRATCPP